MVNPKGIAKKESKFNDRNHFLSLKLIIKANPCTTMLVVAKTVTSDHGETQLAGGIIPSFKDTQLSYMVLLLYHDARWMYK